MTILSGINRIFAAFLLSLTLLISACGPGGSDGSSNEFERREMSWRKSRESAMRDSTSWLTIAGLFWLEQGRNSFGSSGDNQITLPRHSAPAYAGELILQNGRVHLKAAGGAGITLRGKPVSSADLISDAGGEPDRFQMGGLRMWIIDRGGRKALRVRDFRAKRFSEFEKLSFYPPDPDYRVTGRFVPHDTAKSIMLSTVAGTETEIASPGKVIFSLKNKELALVLLEGAEKSYFIIFRDETSGNETYGACRYMSAGKSGERKVELNFNHAVNPPCAYTPYATCPLPPPENILPVRIEAGEKKYPGGGH
ncbi:MAG: DUF1684 domain-containing protein [Candidatus Krumholzibacteriales bacterium]